MRAFNKLRKDICPRCWLRSGLCYCSQLNPLNTSAKIIIVMHAAERERTSSTARLLEIMLSNIEIYQVGLPENPFRGLAPSSSEYKRVLLYPDESAPLLNDEYCRSLDKRLEIIVPDGTWSQARRITQRNESLYTLPRVRIAPEQTNYRLRRNVHDGTLCTAEAVAHALAATDGSEIRDKILEAFKSMSDRILWGRRSVKPFPLQSVI